MERKKGQTDVENKKLEEPTVRADVEGMEQTADVSGEEEEAKTAPQRYKIECCNPINESFGGVSFHNGVAYTDDGFTASWFRNKGYKVDKE